MIRPKERVLVMLILGTFGFVSFATIWYLPDKQMSGANANKVYNVYKKMEEAGRDLILPPPPQAMDPDFRNEEGQQEAPNVMRGHGHNPLEPDFHKVEDKARLLAKVELDKQLEEMHNRNQQRQQLPKPNIKPPHSPSLSSSSPQPAEVDLKPFDKGHIVDSGGAPAEQPIITGGEDSSVKDKRDKVKEMMNHAWMGYVDFAWGSNELRPISRRGHTASIFGSSPMGATIVDALDTLYIMGMNDEFKMARDWVEQSLDFNQMAGDISVFETNIRYVGGLLTAYALTGDRMFLDKVTGIADKLMPAFRSPTGVPYALVNMRTGAAKNYPWTSGSSILSEFGTLHMEFAYLSDATGDPKYKEAVEKVRTVIKGAERPKALYPNYFNPRTGKWGQQHTSVGALGDSFYEYLLKEWLRSGKSDAIAKEMFDAAALDIENYLVKKSPSGLTYIAEWKYGRTEDKMDHLACFAGGMYGLAAHSENDSNSGRWMDIARGITNTCHESYDRTESKLGPEAFRFSNAVEARALKSNERYYILRPETFESYFLLWRLTKDQKYRDWGWEAVQALEKNCRVETGGYTGVRNVYQTNSAKDDVQQSFFLAETLKYLYLLFSDDDLISLDQWVFNTEAHPLPVKGTALYRPSQSAADETSNVESASDA